MPTVHKTNARLLLSSFKNIKSITARVMGHFGMEKFIHFEIHFLSKQNSRSLYISLFCDCLFHNDTIRDISRSKAFKNQFSDE